MRRIAARSAALLALVTLHSAICNSSLADPPWKRKSPTPSPAPTATATPAPAATLSISTGNTSTPPYWVLASTNYLGDARVLFFVDGVLKATENVYPYSLFGDDGSAPHTGSLGAGSHKIDAQLFAQTGTTLLAPGASKTITEGSTTTPTPAPTTFPASWSDRRAIGVVMLCNTVNCGQVLGFEKNPRGWFTDKTIDVTTDAGRKIFADRLLSLAASTRDRLKAMNAQGVIIWDIEGEFFWHPVTYIGDPRLAETLAPELATVVTYNGVAMKVVDAFFKTFTDAGLKVGNCLRPQQLVTNDNYAWGGYPNTWQRGDDTYQQDPLYASIDAATRLQLLRDKASYAHQRWGSTIFYVDSNKSGDTTVFTQLLAACPWGVFAPEHTEANEALWAGCTAPYHAMWYDHYHGTPSVMTAAYPRAFVLLGVWDDMTELQAYYNDIIAQVKSGTVLMFRAWFDDQPTNYAVQQIYFEAAK